MMPRSVAVSRAEVASSQMSSFGDLRHTQMEGPDVSMSRSQLPGRPRWFPCLSEVTSLAWACRTQVLTPLNDTSFAT